MYYMHVWVCIRVVISFMYVVCLLHHLYLCIFVCINICYFFIIYRQQSVPCTVLSPFIIYMFTLEIAETDNLLKIKSIYY